MEKKNNHQHNFGNIIAIILIVLFITAFLFVVFYQKTIKTNTKQQSAERSVIICNRSYQKYGDFFYTENPTNTNISIKTIFKDKILNEISLEYYNTYSSQDDASTASSKNQSGYNTYLGKKQIDIDSFNPSYTIIDNTASIKLYTKVQDHNNELTRISDIFYLNQNTDISSMSPNDLKKAYSDVGFSCTEE